MNDIIDMYWDLDAKELRYAVNDEYFGIAKDIVDAECRMDISVSDMGTSIEFVSYS